jgi:tRNA nucleotidyltransferase/poly(A) polymerase
LENIADLDITTGDETVHFLSKEVNMMLNRVMKVHYKKGVDGHSSIMLGNLKVDFSSNFNDLHIDEYLKQKGIEKPTPMQKEIYSRDFTINTFLMDFNLKNIQDPTNQGLKDLKNKMINTCLAPEVTLKEQKRIIRAIYLAAKLDFNISPEIINFIKNNSVINDPAVTEGFLTEKLSKAMSYNANKTLQLLQEMNLKQYIPIAEKLKG